MGIASDETTQGVRVQVRSEFLPDPSNPEERLWVYAYEVTIENQGERTVQLLRRLWEITNASGQTHEVEGPGVIGQTPILAQGESFVYQSGCPLGTPFGTMQGHYTMRYVDDDEQFDVKVGAFALCQPQMMN